MSKPAASTTRRNQGLISRGFFASIGASRILCHRGHRFFTSNQPRKTSKTVGESDSPTIKCGQTTFDQETELNPMTPEDSPDRDGRKARIGWWAAWLAILVLASAIPYLHWRYDVAEIIEPLRYPWGLLPAHWLCFRWTGEIAAYALMFVCFCGVWAWRQPEHRQAVVVLAAIAALVSSVGSAMLTSRLMIALIHEEAQRTKEKQLRLNMGPSSTPKNSKPDKKQ